ncbi:hypothetical protein ACXZ1K_01985 [Pedobacter sp. PWIIR3]
MQERLEFKKQREFGELIGDTFLFIKQNFKPLLKVFLYLCGFFILASMLSAITYALSTADSFSFGSEVVKPVSPFDKIFSINYFIVMLLSFATYTAMTVSTLSYMALYIEKGNIPPSVEEVWSYFKFFYFRAFGSSFLVIIAMIVSFICCVIPGIYAFPALSIFYSVMIFENASFRYSFSRAFKLVNTDWWGTAAAMFILFIITYAAILIPSIPAAIINMGRAFTPGSKGASTILIIISTILQSMAQVFTIFPIVGVSLCYFNLVERLESGGLLGRIQQMGKDKDQFNAPEEY